MAGAITLKNLEKWMKYTGCSSEHPGAYGSTPCDLISGASPDIEYQKFAAALVRSAIGQAIHTLSQANAPTETYKIACKIDLELTMSDDCDDATFGVSCCGPTCERCLHSLATSA
ncbi:MAG: hypothetical protein AAFY34_15055 [Pseudomonadota bacterium]